MELASNLYFWKHLNKLNDLWMTVKFKIFNHEESKFQIESMQNIRISNLILLKENQFAPADILVLDTGTVKLDKKIFKVKQDKMMGDEN